MEIAQNHFNKTKIKELQPKKPTRQFSMDEYQNRVDKYEQINFKGPIKS